MIYLAEMLRDCSKSRSASFTQLSFPIIQEIQSKIKGKNFNLRKKMKQRLADRQRLLKHQQKKQESKIDIKRDGSIMQRVQKQTINYIQAYEDIKNYQPNRILNIHLQDLRLDERDNQICFQVYNLIRKKKPIFKAEEIKRKMKSKEHPKRISFKQCDCCQKVGKHKCQHKFCEGKCQKLRRAERIQQQALITEDRIEDFGALDIAQDIIDQQAKQENIQLPFIRITKKEEEPLILPKIDVTDKQENMKEQMDGQIANQRERISQNESKSSFSEGVSKRQIERNLKNSQDPIFAPISFKQQSSINQQQKKQQIQIQKQGRKLQISEKSEKKIFDQKQQMIGQQQNEIIGDYNDPNEQMLDQWSQQDDLEEFQEVIPEQQIKVNQKQIKITESSEKNSSSAIKTPKLQIQMIIEKQSISTVPIISTDVVRQQILEPINQQVALQIGQNNTQLNEQSDNFIDHLLQELEDPLPLDENQFLME